VLMNLLGRVVFFYLVGVLDVIEEKLRVVIL